MSQVISTLYEQQYYTVWINKKFKQSKSLLESSKLVISKQERLKVDGVYQDDISIKESFIDELTEINVSFIKKMTFEKRIHKPNKVVLGSDEDNIYISILSKDNKEFQSLKVSLYYQEIYDLLEAALALSNFEIMQIGYINDPPIKFLLQPIILEENELITNTINATASIYEDGLLIIDFDILVHDVPFLQLQNYESEDDNEHYLKRLCRIPDLLINSNSKTPNKYSNKKVSIRDAVNLYKEYIIKLLEESLNRNSIYHYTNYSLIKYDGEPVNFDSISNELSANLYWIINMPRNFTEMSKNVYDKFKSNRHEVTKNATLFVSSMSRSVIALTKEKIAFNKEELSEDGHKLTIKNYIDPVIRILLIKKMYYHKIWSHDDSENDYDLKNKESMLFYFKARINKLTNNTYGSVKRCVEYFELNMVDFLNFKEVDEIIVNFKNKKYFDMTEKNEKLNRRINHLIVLITILFSYNPLDSMLTGLKVSNIIDLTEYLYILWLCLIGITLSIIYIEKIKAFFVIIFDWIKKQLASILASIKEIYYNLRAKG